MVTMMMADAAPWSSPHQPDMVRGMRDDIGPNSDDPWPEVTRSIGREPRTTEGRIGCAIVGLLIFIPTILVGAIWQNGPQPPTIRTLPQAIGIFTALAVGVVALVSGVAWLFMRLDRLWQSRATPGMKSAARDVDRVVKLLPDERTIFALVLVPFVLIGFAIVGLYRLLSGRGDGPPGDPPADATT